MSPRGLTAWPPWALLLLWLPDCVPLSGPSKVTGTVGVSLHGTSKVTGNVGGSLIVQCQYVKQFSTKNKLWCKKSVFFCYDIVKTRGSGGKVRSGRVSISDHPANLSFTVTMERLTLEDAGSYECRVDTPRYKGFFPYFKVEVAVLPALTTASSPESRTSTQRPPTSLSTYTWPLTTREDTPSPHPQPGPLVISVHLLLLALKVLLLLSMLSAVLWVNRPQRSSRSR